MSNTNAVLLFNQASTKELLESIGVTQFDSLTNWHQTIGGILIQGGYLTAVGAGAALGVPYNVGFPKQVVGTFVQPLGASLLGFSVTPVDKNSFTLNNAAVVRDFYWWAIGV